jgi:threonine/homoserine/homoserine lactone efflux protein
MVMIFAMFLFSLTMSITPGPVNMVILASGIHHGVKQTLPYVSGATIGFTLLLLFIGFGFFQFIKAYPFFLTYLAVGGSLFIIYVGYQIASSNPETKAEQKTAPKFYKGFLLQWINPKAWIACIAGVSIFSSAKSYDSLLIFTSIYFMVCYISLASWAILGNRISVLLNSQARIRLFNLSMGSLLITTAFYLAYPYLKLII